jgi:hypothetical protein
MARRKKEYVWVAVKDIDQWVKHVQKEVGGIIKLVKKIETMLKPKQKGGRAKNASQPQQ